MSEKTNRYIKAFALIMLPLFNLMLSAFPSLDHPSQDLRGRIERKSRNYIRSHSSFTEYSIPDRLKPEYYSKIDEIVASLLYKSYVSSYDIDRQVRDKMGTYINKTLKNIVLRYDLTKNVEKTIKRVASNRGVYLNSMPSYTRSEYNRHKNNVENKLRNTMYNDNRNYVRDYEIEDAVKKEMGYFFDSARGSSWNSWWGWGSGSNNANQGSSNYNYNNYNYNWSNDGSNWFSTLFGDLANFFSGTSKDLQNNTLEQKVIDIAYEIVGLSPDNVPARVVSDLGDKIKNVLRRVQNYGYTSDSEIRRIAREELQSTLDCIGYKGEICSICLDGYCSGQRVGILSCCDKHFFHKDCIYQWLEHSKSCPLCRASNVIVSKQENVPW